MLLSDGTDTREADHYSSRYTDGMSVVLDNIYMNGDPGDRMESTEAGEGACRYGRRVLRWDSMGFVGSLRFVNEHDADDWMDRMFSDESA